MQRIADEADVSRSTFYLYFRDKTAVLLKLGDGLLHQIFGIAASWDPSGAAGGLDGLTAMYRTMIRHYRDHAALLAAVIEVAGYDPAIAALWRQGLEPFTQRVADVIVQEQQAGRTPADIDPVIAARLMTWGGEQSVARHVATDDGRGDDVAARELALSRWYGVYRRPAD